MTCLNYFISSVTLLGLAAGPLLSCGDDSSASSPMPTTNTVVGATGTTQLILDSGTLARTTVDVPQGALAAESKVSLTEATQPATIATASSTNAMTVASSPVELAATNAQGVAVATAESTLLLTMTLTSASASLASLTTEDSDGHVCVLGTDGTKVYVWAQWNAVLSHIETETKVKICTKLFTTYQAFWCGDYRQEPFPGTEWAPKSATGSDDECGQILWAEVDSPT